MDNTLRIYLLFIAKEIEGKGYDPDDPGGKTIYGISSVYHPAEYRELKEIIDDKQPQNMIDDKIVKIYSEMYAKTHAYLLNFPTNIQYFDMTFNAGEDDAIFPLQQTIKDFGETIFVDGVWGNQTEGKVNIFSAKNMMNNTFHEYYVLNRIDRYMHKYKSTKYGPKYIRGWVRRVITLEKFIKSFQ